MFEAALGLVRRAAFHTEDDIPRALVLDDSNDARPIDDAIAARAADRCAGDLPALGIRMFDGTPIIPALR